MTDLFNRRSHFERDFYQPLPPPTLSRAGINPNFPSTPAKLDTGNSQFASVLDVQELQVLEPYRHQATSILPSS